MAGDQNVDIDILDVVVFFAENWIAIFLVPAITAIAIYFAAGQIDRPYVATAQIALPSLAELEPSSTIPMLVTRLTLRANQMASDDIQVSIERGVIEVSAVADSHAGAASVATNAILSLRDTAAQFTDTQAAHVETMERHLSPLEIAVRRSEFGDISSVAIASSAELRQRVDGIAGDLPALNAITEGLGQTPIAVERRGRPPSHYAIFALAGAGFIATILCMLRAAWVSAASDPANQDKIRRIRAALLLRKAPQEHTPSGD